MIGLRRARAVRFVIAEEDVLEARLVAGQRDDRITRGGLDDRIRGSVHRQVHPMPVMQLDAVDELLEIGVIDTTTKMGEVLEDLPARQIGIESRLTGHVADEALDLERLLPAIESGDSRRAGVGVQEGHQQPDGRRLACAIGAQETEDVALLDLERDLDDAALAAVALGKFLDFDDGRHVSLFQPNQKCSVDSSVSVSDPFGMPRIRSNASVKDATDRWTTANVMVPAWRAMK